MTAQQTTRIRELNDIFRNSLVGGRIMLTTGVRALGPLNLPALINLVREYNHFREGNDPYGEHDFGSIDFNAATYFWKIDYYDKSLKQGSEDPADPDKTTRVLTVMCADEY